MSPLGSFNLRRLSADDVAYALRVGGFEAEAEHLLTAEFADVYTRRGLNFRYACTFSEDPFELPPRVADAFVFVSEFGNVKAEVELEAAVKI